MRKMPAIERQKDLVKLLSRIFKRHFWYGIILFFLNFIIAFIILIRLSPPPDGNESVVLVQSSTGIGTAFLVNKDGYMLTASHVIGTDNTVGIIYRDGNYVEAQVIFSEPSNDVSLLKLNETNDLPSTLPLGDSDAVVETEEVYVIGYPGGNYSITKGIIAEKTPNYLKTDAATNPGNSGGPLIAKSNNSVIGMIVASRIIAGTVAEGQHYAIPINGIETICLNKGYSLR